MRVIFHVDMDTFFVSVERLSFPWLRGRPVIVGGGTPRSVVASCSYEAREMGVASGMSVLQAVRLAPEAVVVCGSHGSYAYYSRRVLEVLLSHTPAVEPVSIDEAFMDVTDVLGDAPPSGMASRIRAGILEATGLQASIGIASNRFLAKMASARAKPAGTAELTADDIVDFPVGSIWGVGPVTRRRFLSLGIERVSDLRRFSREQLRALLGVHGDRLYLLCRGIDDTPVVPGHILEPPLSVSSEHTFSTDVREPEEYLPVLALMSQKVARRARDGGLAGSIVTLKYRLSSMRRCSRARTLACRTDSSRDIYSVASHLARSSIASRIRLIGVCLEGLSISGGRQLEIFGRGGAGVDPVIDRIRRRYGEKAVTSARTLAGPRTG